MRPRDLFNSIDEGFCVIQVIFDERYWYKPAPNYSPAVLNETERKNLEFLLSEKSKGRNTAISIGDMENFQTVALTEDLLKGLSLMELRMIRNEIWARRGRKFETPGIRQYFPLWKYGIQLALRHVR